MLRREEVLGAGEDDEALVVGECQSAHILVDRPEAVRTGRAADVAQDA